MSTWDATLARPFNMDFDAVVTFTDAVSPTPSLTDVFNVMTATEATYQQYIQNYVWNSQPQGLFFDVQNVAFQAEQGQLMPAK